MSRRPPMCRCVARRPCPAAHCPAAPCTCPAAHCPALPGITAPPDTRYRINQAFEDNLAFINQEWTLGGRLWPDELKALGPSIIYDVNAARVGNLRRFADRLRKWAGDQRNVNRHLEDSSVSVNITPQNFYPLLGKRALRGRSTQESGYIITFQPHSLREFDVFFPPTMSDRHSERAGNVHPRFGHQLSERWYSTHYDDPGGAACAYKVKLESICDP